MMHIPAFNVPHKLLKELAYSFYLCKRTLHTRYGVIDITSYKIRDALGLNASGKNPFCNLFYKSNFNVFYIIFVLLNIFAVIVG
ncbi:hypothetical protein AHAS_Ahas18G0118400 [Arachis hypogaea]